MSAAYEQIGRWKNTASAIQGEPLPDTLIECSVNRIVQYEDGWRLIPERPMKLSPFWINRAKERLDGNVKPAEQYDEILTGFFADAETGGPRFTDIASKNVWEAALHFAARQNLDGDAALQLSRCIAVALSRRKGAAPQLSDLTI